MPPAAFTENTALSPRAAQRLTGCSMMHSGMVSMAGSEVTLSPLWSLTTQRTVRPICSSLTDSMLQVS